MISKVYGRFSTDGGTFRSTFDPTTTILCGNVDFATEDRRTSRLRGALLEVLGLCNGYGQGHAQTAYQAWLKCQLVLIHSLDCCVYLVLGRFQGTSATLFPAAYHALAQTGAHADLRSHSILEKDGHLTGLLIGRIWAESRRSVGMCRMGCPATKSRKLISDMILGRLLGGTPATLYRYLSRSGDCQRPSYTSMPICGVIAYWWMIK